MSLARSITEGSRAEAAGRGIHTLTGALRTRGEIAIRRARGAARGWGELPSWARKHVVLRREGRHLTRAIWPCRRVGRIRSTTTTLRCGQVVRIRQVHRESRIVIRDRARARDSADRTPTVVEGAIAVCGSGSGSSSVGLCSGSKDATTCLRGNR